MDKRQLYYLVSHLLALNLKPELAHEIRSALPKEKNDWQRFVVLGSRHLVLSSIYLSIQRNGLIDLFPEDLINDLQYIHQLNSRRNQSIINQAIEVRDELRSKGIECVFMKGTGNIFDGLYEDLGERMVYDIDILVEEDMMLEAVEVLLSVGYKSQKKFNPKAFPSTMHYPILLREDHVAGVEIHRLPVQYQYLKTFNTKSVFDLKRDASLHKGFWVMDDSHKVIHNFMHSQLMHSGHYHGDVSLRSLYDLLLLSRKVEVERVLSEIKHYKGEGKAYLSLMNKVFELDQKVRKGGGLKTSCLLLRHYLTLRLGQKILLLYHFLITSTLKYIALPIRAFYNKNARNYIFSRLANKHWYREHINAYRRKYLGK